MTRRVDLRPLLFMATYAVMALVTLYPEWIGSSIDVSRVVWFPSGFAVGVAIRYGRAYIGWTALIEFSITALAGDPILFAVGTAIGNGLEVATALLILHLFNFRPSVERGRDVVALVLGGALIGALAGALVSATALKLFEPAAAGAPWLRLVVNWWLTHANGILLGAPVLLALWHGAFSRVRARRVEAVLLGVAVLALGFLLFEPLLGGATSRRFLYAPFPVLIWSAFRFRLVGAAVANLLVTLPLIAATPLSRGPFVTPGQSMGPDALFQLWIFVAVNAVTALFVAGVVEEREREVAARLEAEEERRKLSEQVASARRTESLGVLAGGVAHDFNNLLVSIMGHAELATRRLEAEHPAGDSVNEIMRASQRAAEICRQMLAYVGRGRVSNAPVDLSGVASEMTELLSVSFDEGIQVEVATEERCGSVWGDVTQFRRVTLNLLTNASDAIGGAGGTIRISTGSLDESELQAVDRVAGELPEGVDLVHLSIEDDGPGMSPDLRDRIFEPFYSTKSVGRGLGLAAVLGIVLAHDGVLELRSRVGEGARFRIVLPVTRRVSEAVPAVDALVPKSAGTLGRVLVADDEPGVREVAEQMLTELGAEVEVVSDGTDAIERFRQTSDRYDVVLLDIAMPGATGIETLEAVRRIRPELPALLMTGNVGDAERVEEDHHVPVLLKPFRMAELTAALIRARRFPMVRD